ncbi:MAG: HEAT repeat domain-containing protein [Microcoleaceae cyanobacterium]
MNNRTLTKVGNLQAFNQIDSPTLIANSSAPLYITQNSDSKATTSEETNKEKSTSSNSKVPKQIRSLLKALRGRKTLFLLSIISVLVTGTVIFILLKLFDDHKPSEDFDSESLPSEQKIPPTPSPDLEDNYPDLHPPTWPVAPENSSLANTKDSAYSQTDNSQFFASVPQSQFASPSHYSDIEKQTSSRVDSNSSINRQDKNNYQQHKTEVNLPEVSEQNSAVDQTGNITLKNNYPLPQVNIVEQLISDLQNFDPKKRHHAIWELGQTGDSRAIQPLVNLLTDSDSKQQSLILATLSEIGIRTLQPMNRALAISLQDDNAEVRKNAIRDLTRIYELVIQISNILKQAENDPDPEVEKTAKWALEQLNRIRPR